MLMERAPLGASYDKAIPRYERAAERLQEAYLQRKEALLEFIEARSLLVAYLETIWPTAAGSVPGDMSYENVNEPTSLEEAERELQAAISDFERSDFRLRRAREAYAARAGAEANGRS